MATEIQEFGLSIEEFDSTVMMLKTSGPIGRQSDNQRWGLHLRTDCGEGKGFPSLCRADDSSGEMNGIDEGRS